VSFEKILSLLQKTSGPSLINTEQPVETDENKSQKNTRTFSDNSETEKKERKEEQKADWIEFFAQGEEDQSECLLSKFLTLKLFDPSNFTPAFVDFMRELLMFDPKDRLSAFDLLSHPVFRKYNKVYLSQQIILTKPITRVEKHQLKKLKAQGKDKDSAKDIKIRHLLDIIKLKIKFERKMPFLAFLEAQFTHIVERDQQASAALDNASSLHGSLKEFNSALISPSITNSEYGKKLLQQSSRVKAKKVPTMVRVISKEDDTFYDKARFGANLRLMRDNNFAPKNKTNHLANFLILKSDLEHIQQLNQQTN
jgi:serine/threonine protein kinase